MAKNTSISLGDHFEAFITSQISAGRYGNASEVIRASLRLLEEHEQKVEALRRALVEGEASGDAGALDFDEIRREGSGTGKAYVTIGVGCTGGRHRSVAVSSTLAVQLRRRGREVNLEHRDIEREGGA